MAVTVKERDIRPIYFVANKDLTGTTFRLLARRKGSKTPIELNATQTLNTGEVEHMLTGTLAVGTYEVELEVTDGGEVMTFPNRGYETLTIVDDIG